MRKILVVNKAFQINRISKYEGFNAGMLEYS